MVMCGLAEFRGRETIRWPGCKLVLDGWGCLWGIALDDLHEKQSLRRERIELTHML
jgi:hypothetical protein